MNTTLLLSQQVGKQAACHALGVARASLYRYSQPTGPTVRHPRPSPSRALSGEEKAKVLDQLNSNRFMDQAPAEVYATLLDEGQYLCSVRTMYRLLDQHHQVRERRNQLTHPSYQKPELLASAPNQVWSWDITKLLGPAKWTYFYLYVLLDIFSRYVVGWMVAIRESAALAEKLIRETCQKQAIRPGQLTVHADRGSSMTSKPVALLLADLGVTKTHSRPYTSNDNPFSESHFKTLKYRPEFPDRFGSLQDSRVFCQQFFAWYNAQHHHSALGWLTPEAVHYHRTAEVRAARQQVLNEAYRLTPDRFVRKPPGPPRLPECVWINPPEPRSQSD
jgi:putative transposase